LADHGRAERSSGADGDVSLQQLADAGLLLRECVAHRRGPHRVFLDAHRFSPSELHAVVIEIRHRSYIGSRLRKTWRSRCASRRPGASSKRKKSSPMGSMTAPSFSTHQWSRSQLPPYHVRAPATTSPPM